MEVHVYLNITTCSWSSSGSTNFPCLCSFLASSLFFTSGINKAKTAKNTQPKMLNAFLFFFLLHDEDYGDIFEIALFEVFYFLLCEWYGVMYGCENAI